MNQPWFCDQKILIFTTLSIAGTEKQNKKNLQETGLKFSIHLMKTK